MIVNLLHLCLAYIVMNQYSLSSISMFILVLPDHQSPFLLNGSFFKHADTRVMISYKWWAATQCSNSCRENRHTGN